MPRNSTLLVTRAITPDDIIEAAHNVCGPRGADLIVLDGGAALQVAIDDTVLVTVLPARELAAPDEVQRLLPGTTASADTRWWAEAYTPWAAHGVIGVDIVNRIAQALRGHAVHHAGRIFA